MNKASSAFGFALLLMGVACTERYVVKPATGGENATARAAGLGLVATPDAWDGDPYDLGDYVTAIWVNLENRRAEELRVSYGDLVLTDDSGFRYAAISPYTGMPSKPSSQSQAPAPKAAPAPAQPQQPAATPSTPSSAPAPATTQPPSSSPAPGDQPQSRDSDNRDQAHAFLLAWGDSFSLWDLLRDDLTLSTPETETAPRLRLDAPDESELEAVLVRRGSVGPSGGAFRGGGGGFRGGSFSGGGHRGGSFHRGGGFGAGRSGGYGHWSPRSGVGGYGRPYYYGHYHYYYRPWPYFYYGYYGPRYWGPYVYYWDDRSYPAAPSEDVLRYGLPEGVIKPGGRVAGYVYFQHTTSRPKRLDLTWNAHTPTGKNVGSVQVGLVVVRD